MLLINSRLIIPDKKYFSIRKRRINCLIPPIPTWHAFRSNNQYGAFVWWGCKHLETLAVDCYVRVLKTLFDFLFKNVGFVTSPNNSFVRLHTKNWGSCIYILLQIYPLKASKKSITMKLVNAEFMIFMYRRMPGYFHNIYSCFG